MFETLYKMRGYLGVYLRFTSMLKQALKAPDRWAYSDIAIAPPKADEFEQLSLYRATTGSEAALARKRIGDAIRTTGHAETTIVPAATTGTLELTEAK